MWRLSLFIVLWISVGATLAISGEPPSDRAAELPQVKSIQLGFANHYKLGCWTPVAVTLNGAALASDGKDKTRIAAQAADGEGVPAWFIGPNVSSDASAVHETYVRIGRANQPIRVGILSGAVNTDSSPQVLTGPASEISAAALPATNQFMVELGASIGLHDTFRHQNQNDADRTTVVTIESQQPLPDQWYGYDGVDTIFIAGAAAMENHLLTPAVVDALEQWVQQGGDVVICCGDAAEKVLGANGPLARFAPAELINVINLPAARFGPIENFAGAEQRLEATSIRFPQWKRLDADRRIELAGGTRADDLPLVVRWPFGFGQITFIGLDLDREPFAHWPSREKFLEKLLRRRVSPTARTAGTHLVGQNNQLGYLDLAGQLRGALDQFDNVHLIPFWAVAVLAVAYIALLFPLSYFLVVRWMRQQSLAWAVFAVVIVLFCTAAYTLANYLKGNARRINQIDLTDVDLATGRVRGSTWMNIFSAENGLYDLHVKPSAITTSSSGSSSSANGAPSNTTTLLSWFGLPGSGLGGMNSAAANRSLFDEPYMLDLQQGTIFGVPLAKWSSQSFVARWTNGNRQNVDTGLTTQLAATSDRRLRGTISSNLAAPLTDCVLLFDRWAYPLGTFAPGKSLTLDRAESQTIDTYLTKRRTFIAHEEVPPYDRAGADVSRIIEVMMFYQSTGGANYTGLLNRYQRFTDLTDQLEFGRAILVGRGPAGAEVQIDAQPLGDNDLNRRTSVFRFVIPIQGSGGA